MWRVSTHQPGKGKAAWPPLGGTELKSWSGFHFSRRWWGPFWRSCEQSQEGVLGNRAPQLGLLARLQCGPGSGHAAEGQADWVGCSICPIPELTVAHRQLLETTENFCEWHACPHENLGQVLLGVLCSRWPDGNGGLSGKSVSAVTLLRYGSAASKSSARLSSWDHFHHLPRDPLSSPCVGSPASCLLCLTFLS